MLITIERKSVKNCFNLYSIDDIPTSIDDLLHPSRHNIAEAGEVILTEVCGSQGLDSLL